MWIRIEPLDVLLFRDSKPFSAGENFRAAGNFPPSSLPLVGALRSRALAGMGDKDVRAYVRGEHTDIASRLGTSNRLSPLAAMGPFLVSPDHGLCLPWPKDLIRPQEDDGTDSGSVAFLKPKPAGVPWPVTSFGKDLPLQNLAAATVTTGMEAPAGGFMKGEHLKDYLTEDEYPFIEYVSQGSVATEEGRLGITLSDGRTAETGRIYTAVFKRMREGAAFYLHVRNTAEPGRERDLLPETGFLALGGEARAARFAVLNEEDEQELSVIWEEDDRAALREALIEGLTNHRCFKLYLLTSAIFASGWLPDVILGHDLTWQTASGSEVKARLVAAAVGKPEDIGGWDLVRGTPRPLYRAVPAGSVYFFEAEKDFTQDTAAALLDQLHFQSLMKPQNGEDPFPSFCREAGFGLAAVGLWDDKKEG